MMLLDATVQLIHGMLTTTHGLTNGNHVSSDGSQAVIDEAADEQFGNDVASAIVDWIAQRMSDYHKNFHDTTLMQASCHASNLLYQAECQGYVHTACDNARVSGALQ